MGLEHPAIMTEHDNFFVWHYTKIIFGNDLAFYLMLLNVISRIVIIRMVLARARAFMCNNVYWAPFIFINFSLSFSYVPVQSTDATRTVCAVAKPFAFNFRKAVPRLSSHVQSDEHISLVPFFYIISVADFSFFTCSSPINNAKLKAVK